MLQKGNMVGFLNDYKLLILCFSKTETYFVTPKRVLFKVQKFRKVEIRKSGYI